MPNWLYSTLEWYVELTIRHTTPDIHCRLYTNTATGNADKNTNITCSSPLLWCNAQKKHSGTMLLTMQVTSFSRQVAYVNIYVYKTQFNTLCSLVLQVAAWQRTASNATQQCERAIMVHSHSMYRTPIRAHLVRHVIELTKSNDDFHMWHVQIRDACVMWTTLKTHVTDFSNVNINTFSACSVTANHGFSSLNVSTNTSWHRVQFSASNVYNTLYLNCRDIAKEAQGINCSLKKCQLPQKFTDIFCQSHCFLLVISRDNVNCTLSTH